MSEFKKITLKEWQDEGKKLFGNDGNQWRFKCPMCHQITKTQEWVDVGAPDSAGFACIGRWKENPKTIFDKNKKGNGPCNYTSGGLFNFSPLRIIDEEGKEHSFFDFAPYEDLKEKL